MGPPWSGRLCHKSECGLRTGCCEPNEEGRKCSNGEGGSKWVMGGWVEANASCGQGEHENCVNGAGLRVGGDKRQGVSVPCVKRRYS